MSNKRKREDDSLNTVEELRQRCAELRCSNSVRYMAIKCNMMVVRSIKRILEMEEVPDEKKVGAMRTFFASLDPVIFENGHSPGFEK